MPTFIQPSFAKGVIGPQLYGRVDTAAYQVAIRRGLNLNIHPYGGASNRPGSMFVGPVKDHSYAPALIPFQFKTTDSYMLEFGNFYMRVIRNDAHVTETPKTVSGITKANPAVVNVTAHGFSNGDEVFLAVAGMTQVNNKRYKITVTDADHFSLQDQVTGANVNSTGYSTFTSGTAARIYTIVTPYAIADVNYLKWTQSADVMTLTMKNYPPYELSRLDHASWTLTILSRTPSISPPSMMICTPNTTGAVTYSYKVTALKTGSLEESLPGLERGRVRKITGITQATPGVVTAVAHGFSNGEIVELRDIGGMVSLNHDFYFVAAATADTFQLATVTAASTPISTAALPAYTSGGTASLAIGRVTPTNPVQITLPAHGFSNGDEVEVDGVDYGYTAINGRRFTVNNKTTNTFELLGEDGTAYTKTGVAVSYNNSYGTGDRTSLWTATTNITPDSGTINNLVDGAIGSSSSDAIDLPGVGATAINSGDYFQFVAPEKVNITQVKLFAQATPNMGAWNVQGSDDGSSWTTYGSYTWNATTTNCDLAGTPTEGHRYWRLVKNGAGAVWTNIWFYEVYFQATKTQGHFCRTFVQITNGNATANNTISWDAVAGAAKYNVYKFDNGVYGFIGETTATSFTDDNIAADLSHTPPQAFDPFATADDYPGAVGAYEQRSVFGGSNNAPDTEQFSQTGRPKNFSISSPLQADDGITATLQSGQVNEIRHFITLNDLIVLTSGEEWKVNSGPDSAFSATTIRQRKQSEWGCSHLRPIVIGPTVLFVEDNMARVRSLGYSFQLDGYDGSNMSVLAPHLFEKYGITRWAYALHPESRCHAVREDGRALALTFDKEQEVVAWTEWRTDGKYENVGTLRNPETQASRESGLYFVVKRQINGNTVRYIEKQESRQFRDPRDARFLDCGLTYDAPIAIQSISHASPLVVGATAHGLSNGDVVTFSDIEWTSTYDAYMNETVGNFLPSTTSYKVANKTANTFELTTLAGAAISSLSFTTYVSGGYVRKMVTTISGLDHLEGRTDVAALADGVPVFNLTVTNGAITLANAAGRVNVGLRYISDLETLNVEAPSGNTIQGSLIRVPEVCVRVKETRGIMIGGVGDSADDLPDFTLTTNRELDYNMDAAELFTGDIHVPIDTGSNSNGRITVRQMYPQPMTILAIIPKVI